MVAVIANTRVIVHGCIRIIGLIPFFSITSFIASFITSSPNPSSLQPYAIVLQVTVVDRQVRGAGHAH